MNRYSKMNIDVLRGGVGKQSPWRGKSRGWQNLSELKIILTKDSPNLTYSFHKLFTQLLKMTNHVVFRKITLNEAGCDKFDAWGCKIP